MITARNGLILGGLAFAAWEAIDIFRIDVPAVAAVFAALFVVCTVWFWHRGTARAAAALLVLCAFEAADAPTWNDVSTATKLGAGALGLAGAAAAIGVLLALRRPGGEAAVRT